MDKRIKCTACKRVKFEEDFIKNQKILKTCIGCRDKKKHIEPVKESIAYVKENPIEVTVKEIPIEIPAISVVSHTESHEKVPEKIETKDHRITSHWIEMSGYWIQCGDEEKLHKKLMRKVNRQFYQHCAFPVHKYLTRWVMVDIRDMYMTPRNE